ncbi:hypothetical protein BDV19DRAFT_393994 [Aspergillus venezuelensis]
MGVAVPSVFVSTGDGGSVRGALDVIYNNQASNRQFPKSGPPNLDWEVILPAYHLWHLIGTYNYLLYTGDSDYIVRIWPQFTKGLERSLSLLSSRGIMNITGDERWGRFTYETERASGSRQELRVGMGG